VNLVNELSFAYHSPERFLGLEDDACDNER